MSFLHVIYFMMLLSCGLFAAGYARMSFGHWLFAIAAFPVGILSAFALFKTLGCLLRFLMRWRPLRPVCKSGKCTWEDYQFIETTDQGDVFACGCGDRYVRIGRAFHEIGADGLPQPYMIYKPFGRWHHVSAFLLLSLFILSGCSGSRSHFKRVQSYLNRHPVAAVKDEEMVAELDYFIDQAPTMLPFLQKKAESQDQREAITAHIILTSIARGMHEIDKKSGGRKRCQSYNLKILD